MSGGKLISDHAFFAGKAEKGSVFPKGVHLKDESSAEGAGRLMKYEDTTEAIHAQQEMAKKKVHSHGHKEGTRY